MRLNTSRASCCCCSCPPQLLPPTPCRSCPRPPFSLLYPTCPPQATWRRACACSATSCAPAQRSSTPCTSRRRPRCPRTTSLRPWTPSGQPPISMSAGAWAASTPGCCCQRMRRCGRRGTSARRRSRRCGSGSGSTRPLRCRPAPWRPMQWPASRPRYWSWCSGLQPLQLRQQQAAASQCQPTRCLWDAVRARPARRLRGSPRRFRRPCTLSWRPAGPSTTARWSRRGCSPAPPRALQKCRWAGL